MSFNDDQPRDELGRWAGEGGGGGGGGAAVGTAAADVWAATAGEPVMSQSEAIEAAQNATTTEQAREIMDTLKSPYSEAAQAYTHGGSVLNAMLREDRGGELTGRDAEYVTAIDTAIAAQSPSSQDTVLYRGVAPMGPGAPAQFGDATPPDYTTMQSGDQFTDRGFISATTNTAIGERFATQSGTQIEIHAPAGTQGLSIPAVRGYDVLGESEVVLPRGSVFQVLEPVDPMTGILKVTIAEQ